MRTILSAPVILLSALLFGACGPSNEDLIRKAVDEFNSPEVQAQMTAEPGIEGARSSYAGDSLSIDIRVAQPAFAMLREQDPAILGQLFVESYRSGGIEDEVFQAIKAEDARVVIHIIDSDSDAVIRVVVPGGGL